MDIRFEGSIPKTIRQTAETHASVVQEVTGKGVLYDDMYDCSYRPGWKSSTDAMGAQHADAGATGRELCGLIRAAIRCECEDCARSIRVSELVHDAQCAPNAGKGK